MAQYKKVGNLKVRTDLSPEKQALVNEIAKNYVQQNKQINAEKIGNIARGGLGAAVSGLSFHPILNVPYVGTGVGGAMYDLGQGIVEGQKAKDLWKRVGRGFAIGETVGAVPYVGKFAGKTKAGQAVVKKLDKVGEKVAQNPTVQKAYDTLMTDIRAFNPNKQTVYHGSPYDFNKFSNEAIGTGEGAQAHGYGHYTALGKDVADTRYRKRLVDDNLYENVELNGQEIEKMPFGGYQYKNSGEKAAQGNGLVLDMALNRLAKNGNNVDSAIESVSKELDISNPWKYDVIDFLKNNNIKVTPNEGQLYKLSVPKDDVMLREGATFAQQPKKVQEAIKSIVKENPELAEVIDTRTADEFFEIAQNKLGKKGKNIMKEVFDAELSGDENKIINAWDKYNEFESKNPNITRTDFDPNKIYGYLNNYINNGVDETGQLFQNQYSNTNLYKYLEDEKNFNKALYDKGIKGISYNGGIDGEARVIFNPDDIDIVRKYYNQPNLKDIYNKFINSGTFADALTNP